MSDETLRDVLLQVAGFLTLAAKGFPVSPIEASELLEKLPGTLRF